VNFLNEVGLLFPVSRSSHLIARSVSYGKNSKRAKKIPVKFQNEKVVLEFF
jgi:hypothetical protein